MKVLDLLEEIEEICDTSAGVPLMNKIMVDKAELVEIVGDIRKAMPDEIQQAQFIKDERERILNDAKEEYETSSRTPNNEPRCMWIKTRLRPGPNSAHVILKTALMQAPNNSR